MSIIRDHIFYSVDALMPRPVAAVPYQMAANSLITEAMKLKNVKVWTRNSFKKGNYVFGLSDLDLTVMMLPGSSKEDLKAMIRILQEQKKLYPFIGEANFYSVDLLKQFETARNYFEIERDPELKKYLPESSEKNLNLDKVIFLLRMLFADHVKLSKFPYLRQKKWQHHFKEMNIPFEQGITKQKVIEAIKNLSGLDGAVVEVTLNPLKGKALSDKYIFETEMPKNWKFLFPHKYLWFDHSADEDLYEIKGSPLAVICMKQIEWEIWGLMTQFPYMHDHLEGFTMHINRLVKVSEILSPGSKVPSQAQELIKLVRDF